MKSASIMMLHHFIEVAYNYLGDSIGYNDEGWPIFTKNMFLDVWPDIVIPYSHRNDKLIQDKDKTVLCFYASDAEILPRIDKIWDEIDIYKQYLGVVMPDLSVISDMDYEMQSFIMLVNQLFGAVLAVSGVKIVFNTRIGNEKSISLLNDIPSGIMCSSGFLGCRNAATEFEAISYIDKILFLLPSKLLVYGKKDTYTFSLLENMGINFRRYEDFHSLSKRRHRNGF